MSHYEIRDKATSRKVGRRHDTREEAILAAVAAIARGESVRIWNRRKRPPLYVALVTWPHAQPAPHVERF